MPDEAGHRVDGNDAFLRRLGLWTAVCGISAIPSFTLAAKGNCSVLGMLCGIALFVIAYTAVTGTDFARQLRRRDFVRRTLLIGYGTRLTVTVFPYGWIVDFVPGMLSTIIVEFFVSSVNAFLQTFGGALITTVIQGTFLNIILLMYMWIVYGIQRAFCTPPVPEGCCLACGYNLTGNVSGRCPECGKPTSTTT